ncbi:hypothetical protein [Paracoccus aminovorans]|uniref:hypothetical protein n=1 Tax=Paracoccus aminovorans TaxID=34004 RepID=UPI003CC7A2C7
MKGERTVSELAAEYGVPPTMVRQWKKSLLDGAADIFGRGIRKPAEVDEETIWSRHAKIGELAVADDLFVRKAQAADRQVRRGIIERNHPAPSIRAPPLCLALVVLPRACG